MTDSSRQQTVLASVGLALIIALSVFGSLYWIYENIVLVGHDASAYLTTSLKYAEFLSEITPQTLFQAFTYPPYRTPAIYIAVQPFLRLFGADMDGAQLLNIALSAAVIGLTYLLGARLAGRRAGLFAALLVSLLPMVAAMARLFYTEMFLATMVALNLVALYRCRAFVGRGWSVVWGLSMGVGMLVKWTMPVYVVVPLIWVLWRNGFFGALVTLVRDPRGRLSIKWRKLALAVLVGLAVSALWFWPNREQAQLYPLGNLLFIGWTLLVAATVYLLLLPSSPASNLWAAFFLAATVASLWYLPHSDFAARLLYEDQTRGQQTASPLKLQNYMRYFPYIYNDHFGALAFWLIVPVALLPWLRSLWGRVTGRRYSLNREAAILWLSTLSAFLILSMLSQRNARNLAPLLPGAAVLITLGLWAYPKKIAMGIGVVWISVLAIQWSLFTFGGSTDFFQLTRPLWASSGYVVQPNSDTTDAGYWIGPAVLDRITQSGDERQRLGVLVNSHEIHRGSLGYLIEAEEDNVQLKSLTEADSDGWYDMLSARWLLFKDGDNRNVEAPGQELLARINAGDKSFEALYQEVERYTLPSGETAYLYRRPWGPEWPQVSPERVERAKVVADAIDETWSDNATLLYASYDLAVWVGLHDPTSENFRILDETAGFDLETLEDIYGTIHLVGDHELHRIENWLGPAAYRAYDAGDEFASLTIYGRPREAPSAVPADAAWADVALTALRTIPTAAPGEVIPFEIETTGSAERNLKMSTRLTDENGAVVAGQDRPIAEMDRYGFFVPPSAAPGAYAVVAIVYDPSDMTNIPDQDGVVGTVLAEVTVSSPVESEP